MKVTLKDGSVKEYSEPMSVNDIAFDIAGGLGRAACAGEVDGEVVDLRTTIDKDCTLNILTFKDEAGKAAYRHTASHVMAEAVKNLFPEAKLAIGPSIDTGFYYDFECQSFSRDDLDAIEKEMKKIIKKGAKIERFTKSREDAIAFFKEKNEPYKVELIEDLPEGEEISFYSQGDWTDLCAGPHLMSTKGIKAFKLLSSSGAYWRGDENKHMLTRIYGTAYATKDELKEHLEQMEEAKRRDHNKLGREMKIFTTVDVIGQGLPLIMPNGVIIMQELQRWIEDEETKRGYVRTKTPLMAKSDLYKISGHWDHYKNNMYTTVIDEEDYAIKPMNCPGGVLVYASEPRSYRDLPLRMGELGIVHRHEKSGQLHGLMRVRCFTQDDAHIFMTPEQIKDEIKGVVHLINQVYSLFGFKYHVELSTRPEDSMGSDEDWEMATDALRSALDELQLPYVVNEGDGAFYGPKIDFHLVDCIGRTWQCGTIQVDFQMPGRLGAEYVAEDNSRKVPVMLHRAILGSLERWIGMLIEHYAGAMPVWLSPVQVAVASITDAQSEFAADVARKMREAGIRVIEDLRSQKINYKIRELTLQKLPYIAVVGDKEAQSGTVSVRARGGKNLGVMPIEEFIARVVSEDQSRKNTDD